MPDDDDLDGCDLAFDDPTTNTSDEEADALVMFAGTQWDDPAAVEAQQRALNDWAAAIRGDR